MLSSDGCRPAREEMNEGMHSTVYTRVSPDERATGEYSSLRRQEDVQAVVRNPDYKGVIRYGGTNSTGQERADRRPENLGAGQQGVRQRP